MPARHLEDCNRGGHEQRHLTSQDIAHGTTVSHKETNMKERNETKIMYLLMALALIGSLVLATGPVSQLLLQAPVMPP